MSILPTALQITNGANNINAAQAHMIPRAVIMLTRSEFDAAVVSQRAFIVDLGVNGWVDGERKRIIGEAGERIWTVGVNAASSHARLVAVGAGALTVLLPSDASKMHQIEGVPSAAIGADGDRAWLASAGTLYARAGGQWTVLAAVGGGSSALVTVTGTVGVAGQVLTASVAPGWTYTSIQWWRSFDADKLAVGGASGVTYTQGEADTTPGTLVFPIVGGLAYTGSGSVSVAPLVQHADVLRDNYEIFGQYILGQTPTHAYTFGSAATTPAASVKGVAIKNATDMATHFNAFADRSQKYIINSEVQNYVDFGADPETHVFRADSLGLWGVLKGGSWPFIYGASLSSATAWKLDGTVTPWSVLPADSDGIPGFDGYANFRSAMMTASVGQLIAIANRGLCYISAITPGTSVTVLPLGGTSTVAFGQTIMCLLPMYITVLSTAYSGTILSFGAGNIPAGVQVGYAVAKHTYPVLRDMWDDVYVTALDNATGDVTLNKPITNLTGLVGSRYVFTPRVLAGQIWSKDQFDISNPAGRYVVEFDVTIAPGYTNTADVPPRTNSRWDYFDLLSRGVNGGTGLAWPDTPMGLWCACWAYSAQTGSGSGVWELDFIEMFFSATSGSNWFSSDTIHPTAQTQIFGKADFGYTQSGGETRTPTTLMGRHRIGFAYVRDGANARNLTYHWIDGILVKVKTYNWGSPFPIQLAMNTACGSISQNFAANLMFPWRKEGFQHMGMLVHGVKVWHRPGAA